MYRLFVAIGLPDSIKQQLLTELHYGLPGARWVGPDNLHLNLRFIGEIDGGRFADVREVLSDIIRPPFSLALKGTGFFPPKQQPHTLWAGLEKSEPLSILHNQVESTLSKAGFPRDNRKFAPHITVARLSDTPDHRVAEWLTLNALFRTVPFPVDSFCLYSSALTGHGAEYEIEERYVLNSVEQRQT